LNGFLHRSDIRPCSGEDGGTDDRLAGASAESFGAFILGGNMFGPIRGKWPDDAWKGWWGDILYCAPTFILTHHARALTVMEGGTTFHFVPDEIIRKTNQMQLSPRIAWHRLSRRQISPFVT
jgi:hypothetical protein